MNILQLIQKPQRRGAETFALQLSSHLRAMGHSVTVVSLFFGPVGLEGVPFIALNRPSSRRFFDYSGFRQLAEIIKEHKIDVVQANAGDTLKYAILSRSLFSWKAVVIARNASTVSRYIRNPVVKQFNQWLYKKVDHVIAVADFTRRDLEKLFPFIHSKITVIPIGVEFNEHLRSTEKKVDIIHVGGFSFEKNHVGLISIFAQIKNKIPGVKLMLVGDGPLRERTRDLVRANGLEDSIHFAGSVPDAVEYIRSAKVLVLPSILEGLPGVILESFMCRVPVVAYDAGGIPEIVHHDRTGRLIAMNDEAEFSNAVIDLLKHADKTDRITDEAFALVRDKFNNSQITLRFMELYKKLSGSR